MLPWRLALAPATLNVPKKTCMRARSQRWPQPRGHACWPGRDPRGPCGTLPRALRATGGTFPAARGEFEGFPGLSTAASSLTSILYRGHKGR